MKRMIPTFTRNKIRLWQNKRRFKSSEIHTHTIGPNVSIGHKCKVHRNVTIEGNVTIGDYTYINGNTMIGQDIQIGKFCSIAYNCQIGMPEHPTNFITTSPYLYGAKNILGVPQFWNDYIEPITIGNDVWIGSNTVILQGVTIGDGAIIAAGAVVSKSINAYDIVGGVPAKLIRKRHTEEQIKYLIKLRWWDMSEDELRQHVSLFTSKEEWYEYVLESQALTEDG